MHRSSDTIARAFRPGEAMINHLSGVLLSQQRGAVHTPKEKSLPEMPETPETPKMLQGLHPWMRR
jgi:hypothetical protein